MKKLLLCLFVSASLFSCNKAEDSAKSADQNPLSGTFTERDEKAQRLWTNLNLFTKEDFSFVNDYLAPNYEFRTSADTAVVAKGPEEATANWKKVHMLFKDMSFSEGRVHTFTLNNGEVHSAYFGRLTATGKFTNKTATVPMQIWIKWEGDKVIRQMDMVDSKLILEESAAAAAAAATATPAAK
jgi:ketosteroid isomerase-like protein